MLHLHFVVGEGFLYFADKRIFYLLKNGKLGKVLLSMSRGLDSLACHDWILFTHVKKHPTLEFKLVDAMDHMP